MIDERASSSLHADKNDSGIAAQERTVRRRNASTYGRFLISMAKNEVIALENVQAPMFRQSKEAFVTCGTLVRPGDVVSVG
jgi:hypothetical protein